MDGELRVLYLRDAAELYGGGPAYATPGSAGLDLRACMDADSLTIGPGERACVPAGICVEACVPGAAGFIYSRSGLGAVKGLCVAQGVGVVDADYRGEIMVWLLNTSKEQRTVLRGERVAQLVFQPVLRLAAVPAEGLSDTGRGSGGFGHTGRQ
ncbi:MAG: dUTP diphosphatase [Mailhella sp.]|nr:dUTP diphosphatase [Mailhella sp.]